MMATTVSSSASPAPSSNTVACDVSATYFPHLFLIPAGAIIIILAFLQRRRSFKKDVWGGRPGLVIPIDFLGIDHDRLAIICAFGAATSSIIYLSLFKMLFSSGNPWKKAFLAIGVTVEFAVLYYPYFACLASYHRIIGAMMGLPYVTVFLTMSLVNIFQECNQANKSWEFNVAVIFIRIPMILCHLFIIGKFVIVLYKEFKALGTCAVNIFSHQVQQSSAHEVKLVRPWLRNHVKDLIKPRPPEYKGTLFILRKIYNPEKNFKFSTQTLSVVVICVILLYSISVSFVYVLGNIRKDYESIRGVDMRWVIDCAIAAVILAVVFCVFSLIRFMENHKNNMLRMFKGDKSFIPKTINTSQFMVGKGLRYHSYQIGYFLWGYILLFLLFLLIICFFYLLKFPLFRRLIVRWIKGVGVIAGVAFITRLSLPIVAITIFRDRSYSKDVISINNSNVYLVFAYFWFFIGLPMGFFSAIFRILKVMAVGALMLPRIDHSIMPDGFQLLDPGFKAYVGYLHVQTAFRNPVLRVFCQTLSDEIRDNTRQKCSYSPQARNRWFLALTLMRNPQLASERKPKMKADIFEQAGFSRCDDVKIEVRQDAADHFGLIQDK